MHVAEAAITTLEQHDTLPHLSNVGQQGFFLFVPDFRAHRYGYDKISAIGAVALASHALLTLFSPEMLLEAVVDQCVQPGSALEYHVAAATAISAIGAAEGDVALAAETDAAIAAVAALYKYLGFIKEFHSVSRKIQKERRTAPFYPFTSSSRPYAAATGTTFTNMRPDWLRR